MIPLNADLVFYVFITTAAIGAVAKLYKWRKVSQSHDSFMTRLQIKYFICYFSFLSGFIFQGPYVHHRYHEAGISNPQIDNIMSTFNVVSAIWGFFIGYICELFGHKNLIILSAILLGASAFCRYIGTYTSFLLASLLMGVSTASNRVVFEDWLAVQLEENKAPKESQAIIKENSALINFILNLVLAPVSTQITTKFGSKAAFLGSTILFGTSATIIFLSMPRFTRNVDKNVGLFGAGKEIVKNLKNFEYAIFLAIDFLSGMLLLLYNPRWTAFLKIDKNDKLPFSQISNTASISSMNGAQIFAAAITFVTSSAGLTGSFFSFSIAVSMMYMMYENKTMLFIAYVCAAMSDGAVNSGMWIHRTEIYPSNIRKHLMGVIRVPQSLIVTLILQLMKGRDTKDILGLVCGFAIIASSLMAVIAIKRRVVNSKKA